MKNKTAILSLSALTFVSLSTHLSAGDREWAAVGHSQSYSVGKLRLPLPWLPPLPPLPGGLRLAGPRVRVIASAPTIPCSAVIPPAPVVYVEPASVRYCPPPVVYVPVPVCAPPRLVVAPPVLGARFGFGHGFYRHHGCR